MKTLYSYILLTAICISQPCFGSLMSLSASISNRNKQNTHTNFGYSSQDQPAISAAAGSRDEDDRYLTNTLSYLKNKESINIEQVLRNVNQISQSIPTPRQQKLIKQIRNNINEKKKVPRTLNFNDNSTSKLLPFFKYTAFIGGMSLITYKLIKHALILRKANITKQR